MKNGYQVQAADGLQEAEYTPRGGCAQFFYCRDHEFIAEGPAETGKTLAACWKVHLLALKYPGMNGAIVRKTQKSVYGTVLQTFKRVIKNAPVEPYGGSRPEQYIYANGSTIWVGGMDNPDKVLSSERDFFYVNQAEELTIDDWEKMTTRTTGRGAVMPYTFTFGDCNPGGSKHWIRARAQAGALNLIRTTHRDNPRLYTSGGILTPDGQRTMETLQSLTGVRRKRLLDGIWATAEGAVYDGFDAALHVTERPESEMKAWFLACDEGYTNPAVILLVGQDSDLRLHIHRQFYRRGVLQADYVETAREWCDEIRQKAVERFRAENHGITESQKYDIPGCTAYVDEAAAGLIADMRDAGINTFGSKGRVLDGIQAVQNMLQIKGDNRPRLTVDPSCTDVINEFESYIWKPEKDEPVKENDHAMDALRYLVIKVESIISPDQLVDWV
jgi:phage terminase large subunit